MLEDISIKPEGWVKISSIVKSKENLIYSGPNAILASAQRVIAHNASNQANSFIDTMEVYDGLILKASISTVVATVNAPALGPYKSIFTGLFPVASFSGDFDRVILKASGVDSFSELTLPAPLTKLPTQQISIQWTINFI